MDEGMKESGSTVPCLHFRDKLLQLAQYAKSGRVDLDFVSWLRNSILVLVLVLRSLVFGLWS